MRKLTQKVSALCWAPECSMDTMLFFKAVILVTIINQKNVLKEMVPSKICGTLIGRCGREAWASLMG